MGLFGRGKITEEVEENSGLVTVSIRVNRKSRQERKVKLTIVEQDTEKEVFKAEFIDAESSSDYFAKNKAEVIARQYCRQNDYIIGDKVDNTTDSPVIETSSKRTR